MMNIRNFKLPLDIFSQAKKEDDIYLGLFLKEKGGSVFFIENKKNKLEIIAKESFAYTNGWDNITEDVDDALYKLETNTKKSPEKAIFFIFSHLIDDTSRQIQKPILHKIKELSKNLELKPLGYIECHEGISSWLEEKEGTVSTSTLIELDSSFLTVFIYKAGKVVYKETVKRSSEIIDDLIGIFEKVKHIAMIPPRIILYDSKDLGMQAEKILSYRWSSELFMQLPKVEIIEEHDLLASLIGVFSQQVFSTAEQKKLAPEPEEKKETFGFVIGGDVEPKKPAEQITKEEPPADEFTEDKPNALSTGVASISAFLKTSWSKAKAYLQKARGVPIPVLAVVGVGIILLALFLIEFNFHKAEVIVTFPGKSIAKNLSISASTDTSGTDLRLTKASASTDISDSKSTTGKKEIGEKAKGSVTIYNSSLTEGKSFSKGTSLSAPDSPSFVLNADVKVSSASGDATDSTPSTAKADVTASDIGPEGNIGAGKKFTLEGESAVVIAKNDSAFTGGVKRSVQVVAKQDVDSLKAQVTKKAQSYTDAQTQKTAQGGTKVLSNLSDVELKNLDFSGDAGDEAAQLSLKAKADVTYFTYNDSELLKLIQKQLSTDVNKGFELPENTIKYTVGKINSKRGEYQIALDVKAKQVKSIQKDELEKQLAGKSEDELERIVKERFGASGLEFRVDSPLPLMHNRLPFFKRNIDLKVTYL